ncbi:MAG: ATP synthase F1 subunit gamma [Armatimonadetes bacterium]|nr:ATP synthase F1 subunit gamma [Armatimonadota bacterium]
MAGIREIRRRIKTIRNVQQITKALKLVSAARLQRVQSKVAEGRPYAREMHSLIMDLSAVGAQISHPLLEVREPVNIGVLVITSDRGMAGGYSTNVIRKVDTLIKPYGKEHVKLVIVGRRANVYYVKRGYDIASFLPMPTSEITFAEARQIGREIMSLFETKQVDVVYIVHTRFFSAIKQQVTELQLLPVRPQSSDERQEQIEYIFEPLPGALFASLLPRYVNNQIYQAMLESLASEHAARMTAMTLATDNAEDMISDLTVQYNRARQAAITKELTEIVSSAEAVK